MASNKASAYLTGCPRLTSLLSVPASSQHPKGTRQRRDRHAERGSPHVLMGRGQAVVVQWGWPGWHQFLISGRHGSTSPRKRGGGPPALQTGPPPQTLRGHPPLCLKAWEIPYECKLIFPIHHLQMIKS